MKVLNLRCAQNHAFEGWFGSEDDYQSQSERGLIECPLCADKAITKLPSAPRLNVSGASELAVVPKAAPHAPQPAALQSMWLHAVQHVMANTVDVGDRFAEEARRIHYGEAQEQGIRGRASPQDAEALREEGIDVVALPVPAAAKGTVQ